MFVYNLKYRDNEKDICLMEMRHLFNEDIKSKYFINSLYVDPDISPFIKGCINVSLQGENLDEVISKIISQNVSYENFKVKYIDIEKNMEFNEKHKIEDKVGYEIKGEAELHEPDVVLGITKLNGVWFFGEYKKNNNYCNIHDVKPYYYCNALPTKFSRAAINILIGRDRDKKIIDPCCGIGTTVVEALSMNLNIKGYDINPDIVSRAKSNLKYFDMPENAVSLKDMFSIDGKWDAAIVDLPYGVFSISSIEEQRNIIKKVSTIADRMIIASIENFDADIENDGFKVIDSCSVEKRSDFKRLLTLCERK